MARTGRPPQINWQESRGQYVVTIRGTRHRLGTDLEAAEQKFKFLLQQDGHEDAVEPNPLLIDVAEAWLEHVEQHQDADRYRNVLARLKEFNRSVGVGTRIDDLKPIHVDNWIKDKPTVTKPGTVRLYKAVILACLNWAATKKEKGGGGLITHNPLKGRLFLPEGGSRGSEVMWTEAVYKQVLQHANPAFANVVRILRWTGCRPSLICRIEAKHYNATTKTWDVKDLYPDKPGSKKRTKRVWLPPQAQELVLSLNAENPVGTIFLNAAGNPWNSDALQIYLYNMMTKFKETKTLKWPAGLCMYGLRHSFATDFIRQHPDKIEYLRELLGHKDLEMIRKHYGHLYDEHSALHDALNEMKLPE
jgi:integrase